MLMAILCGLRLILLVLAGHKQVALENAALRQQLAVLKRSTPRPQLRQRDRLFWILLMRIWKEWRSALVLVQPDTAVGWQRNRFRRYWSRLSRPKAPGRPQISAELRTLVRQMAAGILSGAHHEFTESCSSWESMFLNAPYRG